MQFLIFQKILIKTNFHAPLQILKLQIKNKYIS